MNCEFCNKKIVPIGNSRKNGKNHSDWYNRKYHKKCWVTMMEFEMIKKKYEK